MHQKNEYGDVDDDDDDDDESRVDNVLLGIITLVSSAPIESDYICIFIIVNQLFLIMNHLLLKYKELSPSS